MAESELIVSMYVVAALFFVVAAVYSSVGLGGGSSYTALMAILGFSTLAIPFVSLTLNLIVTSVGSFNFIRNRHAQWRLILPFVLSSIPMAYLGGALDLPKEVFYGLLLVSLVFVAARIYLWQDTSLRLDFSPRARVIVAVLAGGILGLVAGIVGIGGGVYLVPLIIILGLGSQKEAAACGAIFVWLNSLSGLLARLQYNAIDITAYWPLVAAVLLGGFAGSWLGAFRLAPRTMDRILGVIILVAIVALLRKVLG
ncbi:MAG TPA: sulfite exporter TauE/SafE family protein [Gammaproteobacteria bacterium]|nr:sulfite exporter TauE/SafE family protein [Gammaproteobacteria bacterium]